MAFTIITSNTNVTRISDGVYSSWMPNYRYIPENEITLWDKKRTKMGFQPDCGCIETVVSDFFPEWLKKRRNVDAPYKDIIDLHYGLKKGMKMSERGKKFIQDFLSYLIVDDDNYPLLYLESKCRLSSDEAVVVLAYLCREGYTNHGSSVRGSYPVEKGRNFAKENPDWEKEGKENTDWYRKFLCINQDTFYLQPGSLEEMDKIENNYFNMIKPWKFNEEIPDQKEAEKIQMTDYCNSYFEEKVPKLLEDI